MKRTDPADDHRITLSVRLHARSSHDEIVGWTPAGELKIKVTSPPVDEAANQHLIRLLAGALSVRKRDISIASGGHSHTKRLLVPADCENRLLSYPDI